MRLGYTFLSYKTAMNTNREVTIESLLKSNERMGNDLEHFHSSLCHFETYSIFSWCETESWDLALTQNMVIDTFRKRQKSCQSKTKSSCYTMLMSNGTIWTPNFGFSGWFDTKSIIFLGLVSNTFNFNFCIWTSKTKYYSEIESLYILLGNSKIKKCFTWFGLFFVRQYQLDLNLINMLWFIQNIFSTWIIEYIVYICLII